MDINTELLFARPSISQGIGSLMEPFCSPAEYNFALSGAQADALALASDRRAIEGDFWAAMRQFAEENDLPFHPPAPGRLNGR
jgi:hypothetical protein